MMENKNSTLNPLASSFVPGKIAETNSMRELAQKYLKEAMEKKTEKEANLSEKEISDLVAKLISLKYNANSSAIEKYLLKVKHLLTPAIKPVKCLNRVKPVSNANLVSFDLSKFQMPDVSNLLVAFWGLYRHAQAERPLLSLSQRPELVTNKVWSLSPSDKKLWNSSCVEKECLCPPIFGYIIPASLFGNPFYLKYKCPIQSVHMNHYSDSVEGNEFILTNTYNYNFLEEQPFYEDFNKSTYVETDIFKLSNSFKSLVYDIERFLDEILEKCDVDNECETEETEENLTIDLWGEDLEEKRIPFSEQNGYNLVDDNIHPLLENQNFFEDEVVSLEIEEMIRRSLSPKKNQDSSITAFEDIEIEEKVKCNPPCSIWCTSVDKGLDQVVTVDVKLTIDEEPEQDIVEMDLLPPESLQVQKKPKTEKFAFADLKPILDLAGPAPRPFFRRAFSVNDCDPHYYDVKFGFNSTMSETSSKDMLTFLKRDPVNFFKTFNRSNSWKDTDSGFVSHWPSQEDMYGEKDCYRDDDKGSMWGLFSGEDSLWKPLPECAIQIGTDETQIPHIRARDLRRQRSAN